MPRGSKKSIETQITEIEAKKELYQSKINNLKDKIADLDYQIKEIKNTQEKKQYDDLLKLIKASGKTPDQVMAAISNC